MNIFIETKNSLEIIDIKPNSISIIKMRQTVTDYYWKDKLFKNFYLIGFRK